MVHRWRYRPLVNARAVRFCWMMRPSVTWPRPARPTVPGPAAAAAGEHRGPLQPCRVIGAMHIEVWVRVFPVRALRFSVILLGGARVGGGARYDPVASARRTEHLHWS